LVCRPQCIAGGGKERVREIRRKDLESEGRKEESGRRVHSLESKYERKWPQAVARRRYGASKAQGKGHGMSFPSDLMRGQGARAGGTRAP